MGLAQKEKDLKDEKEQMYSIAHRPQPHTTFNIKLRMYDNALLSLFNHVSFSAQASRLAARLLKFDLSSSRRCLTHQIKKIKRIANTVLELSGEY